MAKPEWGSKHRCTSCGAKFYDFHKKTLICPKCDAEVQPEVLLRSRRTSVPEEKKVVAPKVVEKVEADTDDSDDDDGDDDASLEGDDADAVVIEADDDDEDVVEEAVVDEKSKTADT